MQYQSLSVKEVDHFTQKDNDKKITLSLKHCPNTITITDPFILNEDLATLAGMMPDASLIKDLRRIYFSQKKDIRKNIPFKELLTKIFSPNNTIFIREGHHAYDTYINSTVLAHFLHYVLDFKKSDEEMRIPKWLFNSPDPVKRAYLHEAFAMEGTIFKSLKEIRFITKDQNYALDIKRLLLELEITSFVKERIAGTPKGIQYRISIYRKENFEKFKLIGFSMPLHVERFRQLCDKYGI